MLILGWLLLGIALLAIEAGTLSLGAPTGEYVSIVGALRYNLLGVKAIPFSTWPWKQESISGAITSSAESTAVSLGKNFFEGKGL